MRPIGCINGIFLFNVLEYSVACSVIGVSTNPGHKALIRIFSLAYSNAVDFVRPINACLLTEYGVKPIAFPMKPEVDEMFIIDPGLLFSMKCLISFCRQCHIP